MKRFLTNGILFLLLSIGIYLVTVLSLNSLRIGGTPAIFRVMDGITWYGGDTYERFKEYEKNKKNDIVIIGSSHSYRGYDPRIFKARGISAFNLGSHSQTVGNSRILIEEVLDKEHTDLLIYEVYPMLFEAEGLESTSFLIANNPSDKAALKMAWNLNDIRAVNMLSVRLCNKVITPYAPIEEYTYRGYCSNADSIKTEAKKLNGNSFKPLKLNIEDFQNLIEYTREENISLLLVTHPLPIEKGNKQFQKFNEFIAEQILGTGIEHWDYAEYPLISAQEHFYDGHHLNQAGVEIFNNVLIDDLERKGILTSK